METASTLCLVLMAGGVLCSLCPEERTLLFVRGLMVLSLLCSLCGALLSVDLSLALPQGQAEDAAHRLEAYIDSEAEGAAEEQAQRAVEGLLAAAGVQAKKISVNIDSSEASGIVLAKVAVACPTPVDGERARALLKSVLGEGTEVEVTVDGA